MGRRLSALRTFYRFLMKRKMVTKDPAHLVRAPKKDKTLPGYVREEEMNRLFDGDFFDASPTSEVHPTNYTTSAVAPVPDC